MLNNEQVYRAIADLHKKRGGQMKDALKYYIALFGEPVGIALALMVILWDFFMKGSRCFFEYAIGWQGVLILMVGMTLIILSKHFKRTF